MRYPRLLSPLTSIQAVKDLKTIHNVEGMGSVIDYAKRGFL